jgi:predicted DNA-binding transcriptional regulator AlpA
MMTEQERIIKRREHNQRYREQNKLSINARARAKTLRLKMPDMPVIDEQLNIIKKEVAKLVGVKILTLERILKDKKYNAPKHIGIHFDGTVLYNRAEIMEWIPYVREASAFIGKGKIIKITGMAAQIVEFMHKNKKVELFCDELRRNKTDGRLNNG